ncbi:RNA polymerase subunit sigma-70 [Pedobacter sp. HMWF019]|uniref:RNA polymerase sigma factor n=1 Tax=Pedobacter sp. HMWF019 TaxID=2056856 RepID=UPI000D34686B|nr:sigma-70 family RNA polymerase sigma factor [Pedobacter sp. HMWF019]PTS95369.1 RNA polymerase subunit sigma-70 [Pedobacter sp. HMWF019]
MSSYNLSGERMLLKKIAEGDELAFKHVFELYRNKIYAFVLRFVYSEADAEEIVQDTFFTLWQKRLRLTEVEHPRNYIYTIARHNTYHYLNQVAKSEKLVEQLWVLMQAECNSTEHIMDVRDSEMLIQSALSHLSAQKREVFRMSREQGLSHDEIASMLSLSKSRVKNILVETLKYLKYYMSLNTMPIGWFLALLEFLF